MTDAGTDAVSDDDKTTSDLSEPGNTVNVGSFTTDYSEYAQCEMGYRSYHEFSETHYYEKLLVMQANPEFHDGLRQYESDIRRHSDLQISQYDGNIQVLCVLLGFGVLVLAQIVLTSYANIYKYEAWYLFAILVSGFIVLGYALYKKDLGPRLESLRYIFFQGSTVEDCNKNRADLLGEISKSTIKMSRINDLLKWYIVGFLVLFLLGLLFILADAYGV